MPKNYQLSNNQPEVDLSMNNGVYAKVLAKGGVDYPKNPNEA